MRSNRNSRLLALDPRRSSLDAFFASSSFFDIINRILDERFGFSENALLVTHYSRLRRLQLLSLRERNLLL